MDSTQKHILDRYINEERMDEATSSVRNQYLLPLRPLLPALRDDNTQTEQTEHVQAEVTYPNLEKSEKLELEAKEPEPKTSWAGPSVIQSNLSAKSSPGPPPDTLVFIDYPNTARFSEYAGINSPFRVHSKNLLQTGSKVFRELLSPTKNFRTARRRKLVNQLPEGITYVIDLTPPDEGDEAVDLTADLSLTLGIRQWYIMWQRGLISNVGGSDESADSDLIPVLALESTNKLNNLGEGLKPYSSSKKTKPPLWMPLFRSNGFNAPRTQAEAASDLETAVLLSKTSGERGSEASQREKHEVPEYSNIRHRLGIQRLLQVLEGRDPDLDSAPKVWTLWVLAKYFDCTISVVDHISKWLLAEPNSLFVEILPEMSAKMGLGLQTHAVSRAAFSVLVGEEALALICRRRPGSNPEVPTATRFGRRREDIDEDLKNRIEYASKAFEERISSTFEEFFRKDLAWLDQLSEYKKIAQFQDAIYASQDKSRLRWLQCVQLLRHLITSFIRRQILGALNASLIRTGLGKDFAAHRNREALDIPPWSIGEPLFMYEKLSMPERVFTRCFWSQLRTIGFTLDSSYSGNYSLDREGRDFAREEDIGLVTYSSLTTAAQTLNEAIIEAISAGCHNGGMFPLEATLPKADTGKSEKISRSTMGSLKAPENLRAKSSHYSSHFPVWHDSKVPIPSVNFFNSTPERKSPARNDRSSMILTEEGFRSSPSCSLNDFFTTASSNQAAASFDSTYLPPPPLPAFAFELTNPFISKSGMTVPENNLINADSPFLSLSHLLFQVNDYVTRFCNDMLSTRTMGFEIATTDVLVCLNDNEFKYLPVFAGGEDDGTGLVFTDPLPEANGMVPIGPGPSFRTGFSMSNGSMGSADDRSEFSYGCDTETSSDLDHGSKIVEDGFSGVFPRMRMAVGSDVASVAWTDGNTNTEFEFEKGKGIVMGKATEIARVFTPAASVADNISVSGDTSANGKTRDVDMEKETAGKFEEIAVHNNDHDMESATDIMNDAKTISAITIVDEDNDFSNYDYEYGYGYEENEEDNNDDNDTTIGDAGDSDDVAIEDVNGGSNDAMVEHAQNIAKRSEKEDDTMNGNEDF